MQKVKRARARCVCIAVGMFCVLVVQGRVHGETWTAPVDLSSVGNDATSAHVSINNEGQTVSVWVRGTKTEASTMTFGGAWSSPVALCSLLNETGYAPSVKINALGEALAVWGGGFFEEPYAAVFSATHLFGKGWCQPIGVCMGELQLDAQLAFNDSGEGVVVVDNHIAPSRVEATKYSLGGRWDEPFVLSEGDSLACESRIAMASSGRVGMAWKQLDGAKWVIYAELSSYNGFWPSVWPMYGTALSDAEQSAQTPQVAMNCCNWNQVVVVWSRSNGDNTIIQERCLSVGEMWDSSFDLSAVDQDATDPQVAINFSGQIVYVWTRSNGANTIIQASTAIYGTDPSGVVDLSAAEEDATDPKVALNDAGQAVVVWSRSNGTNKIVQAVTLNFGESWSSPVDLSAVGQNAVAPHVDINAKGEVVSTWSRSNGTNKIIQATTTSVIPLPPVNLSGVQVGLGTMNTVTSYYNRIKWESSPTENVVQYNIYHNGGFLVTVPNGINYFEEQNQAQGVPVTYTITAVTGGGAESPTATIVVPAP